MALLRKSASPGSTRPVALVTGASAGLGLEFARQLTDRGFDVVLVARDSSRLEAVAAELRGRGGRPEVLVADLASRDGVDAVAQRLQASDRPVEALVNNAGMGVRGAFDRTSLGDQQALLNLLVTAPMRLSHAALGAMLPTRHGTIINVASIAGLTPRDSYGAAKAWVISFSRWAHVEYRRAGVTVTVVQPGFVRTEFHERMRVRDDTVPRWLWLKADRVVRAALRAADDGRMTCTPSLRYKAVAALVRVLPTRLSAAGSLHPR
ncbi:SDR family NAD(P)-dependent oxidoreductase [Ruicaihuangia caeni]|uniref:SDR family NAD(P)-dependent oxidoreductase n=1 Tax=Ruicaihuangia caeni TaxID=3042517 RepID=A0AAW6TCF5_9MICO|nr:SDR family NAD(P)-dependent oxidoreductase [Klugiella sp. YN-L-19]MDI2099700.1 SDR family NAD(P)-dependent oxidoreductase [Klugiella sp. YN-L-19]